MLDLKYVLQSRLLDFELLAKQGVIPGQLDTYELQQTIGRIKELKLILSMLEIPEI